MEDGANIHTCICLGNENGPCSSAIALIITSVQHCWIGEHDERGETSNIHWLKWSAVLKSSTKYHTKPCYSHGI
jgi:hypothetical protein